MACSLWGDEKARPFDALVAQAPIEASTMQVPGRDCARYHAVPHATKAQDPSERSHFPCGTHTPPRSQPLHSLDLGSLLAPRRFLTRVNCPHSWSQ